MPGQPTIQTTIRLPVDLAEWLEAQANKRKTSKAQVLIELMRKEQGTREL